MKARPAKASAVGDYEIPEWTAWRSAEARDARLSDLRAVERLRPYEGRFLFRGKLEKIRGGFLHTWLTEVGLLRRHPLGWRVCDDLDAWLAARALAREPG